MRNKYHIFTLCVIFSSIIQIVGLNAIARTAPKQDTLKASIKLKDNRPNRPIFNPDLSTDFQSFMLKVSAIKSGTSLNENFTNTKISNVVKSNKPLPTQVVEIQKPIDNVKIYPNPISNQLNLSYTLSKDYTVTVKILDVLGNEVATLLSQKISAGEQVNSFNLTSKLNSGIYFIRIIAGSESIIKRISVL
jgi:hypothetical protein